MSLTICLLNWKREKNLRRILDALKSQTIRPTIFLWNNSPKPFRHEAVDWLVESSQNRQCLPRWWMAGFAETEFVASLDDDLIMTDDRVFEDAIRLAREQPEDRAIGPVGAILPPEKPFFPHKHLECPARDWPVDLVKGRCLIVRTEVLRRTLSLAAVTKEDGSCDDIVVCGALAAGRRLHHLVPSVFHRRFKNLAAGKEALAARPDHYPRREAARRRWLMGSVPA